jgi:putative transposase
MSSDERTQLLAMTRSRSLPAALTLRAKIVLACEREPSNAIVATQLGIGPHTIGKWRNRFIADRIEGLHDEMRKGRPRAAEDEAVAELITKTLARKPRAATHWTVRPIAKETGIPKSTVHRLFQLFGLQPHRTRSFKLSTDPFFVEKLRDVVGLYLNPPDKRRARSKPSNAPSPCSPWGSATSKASPTTTGATARPPPDRRAATSTALEHRRDV